MIYEDDDRRQTVTGRILPTRAGAAWPSVVERRTDDLDRLCDRLTNLLALHERRKRRLQRITSLAVVAFVLSVAGVVGVLACQRFAGLSWSKIADHFQWTF